MRLFSVYVAFFMLNSVALLIGTGIGMLVYEADFSEFDRFYIPGTWKSALLDMCCAFGTTMVPLYFALINRLFCKKVSFWKSDELRIFPVRCLRVRYPVIYGILAVVLVVFLVTIPYSEGIYGMAHLGIPFIIWTVLFLSFLGDYRFAVKKNRDRTPFLTLALCHTLYGSILLEIGIAGACFSHVGLSGTIVSFVLCFLAEIWATCLLVFCPVAVAMLCFTEGKDEISIA